MTEPLAVADAGPLIHLDEVDLAAALSLFSTVLVPPEVAAEIKRRPGAPGNAALAQCKLYPSSGTKPLPIGSLSAADVAGIQLAREHQGILLTDDLDLRDTANLAGIQVVGTTGIIVRAGRIGTVSSETAKTALDALLPESTLFITQNLINQAKAALGP